MSKLIHGKINLNKIKDDLLYVGEKGTYCSLTIWLNDEPDQFGNHVSIQQSTKKDEDKIYLGQGKYVEKEEKDQSPQAKDEWRKGLSGAMSDINDLPGANEDLPY